MSLTGTVTHPHTTIVYRQIILASVLRHCISEATGVSNNLGGECSAT